MPGIVGITQLGVGSLGASSRARQLATVFPLKVSGRVLVDQRGVAFPVLGDSGWNCGISLSPANAATYFADRQARGFNSTLLYFNHGSSGSPANWAGNNPFTKQLNGSAYTDWSQHADFSTANTTFFANVDTIIKLAASYGICVFFFPAYLGFGEDGSQGWYPDMEANSTAQLQAYGNFIGARYSATNFPNIVWVMGGDDNPTDPAPTNTIANTMISAGATQPMTAHAADGTNASTEFGGNAWLTVDSVYTDEPAGQAWIHTRMQGSYTGQTRPCFMIEACYEFEHSANAKTIRMQNWESMLNGGTGYFFGGGGSVAPEPLYAFLTSWQTLLGTTGALGAQALNGFIANRRFDLLVPDTGNTFLTNGASYTNANFASAALASDGSFGVIYVPVNESLTVALSGFSAPVHAYWVDPTNGNPTFAGVFANSGSRTFQQSNTNTNGDADWVLLLQV